MHITNDQLVHESFRRTETFGDISKLLIDAKGKPHAAVAISNARQRIAVLSIASLTVGASSKEEHNTVVVIATCSDMKRSITQTVGSLHVTSSIQQHLRYVNVASVCSPV